MVMEYDMETSAGTEHVTVNAKDVGDKIRWEQLDGTIDFQPQERGITRMSLDIGHLY